MSTHQSIIRTLERSSSPLPSALIHARMMTPEPLAVVDRMLCSLVSEGEIIRRRHHSAKAWFYADHELKFGPPIVIENPPQRERTPGAIARKVRGNSGPSLRGRIIRYLVLIGPATIPELCKGLAMTAEDERARVKQRAQRLYQDGRLSREGVPGKFIYSVRET